MLRWGGHDVVLDDVDLEPGTLFRIHEAVSAISDQPDRTLTSLLLLVDAILLVRQPGWTATVLERPDGAYLVGVRRR